MPGQRDPARPPEGVAEVAELDAGEVLDQPEQVGAGRRQRPARVVVAQPLDLPDHRVAGVLQVADQGLLGSLHEPTLSVGADRRDRIDSGGATVTGVRSVFADDDDGGTMTLHDLIDDALTDAPPLHLETHLRAGRRAVRRRRVASTVAGGLVAVVAIGAAWATAGSPAPEAGPAGTTGSPGATYPANPPGVTATSGPTAYPPGLPREAADFDTATGRLLLSDGWHVVETVETPLTKAAGGEASVPAKSSGSDRQRRTARAMGPDLVEQDGRAARPRAGPTSVAVFLPGVVAGLPGGRGDPGRHRPAGVDAGRRHAGAAERSHSSRSAAHPDSSTAAGARPRWRGWRSSTSSGTCSRPGPTTRRSTTR